MNYVIVIKLATGASEILLLSSYKFLLKGKSFNDNFNYSDQINSIENKFLKTIETYKYSESSNQFEHLSLAKIAMYIFVIKSCEAYSYSINDNRNIVKETINYNINLINDEYNNIKNYKNIELLGEQFCRL